MTESTCCIVTGVRGTLQECCARGSKICKWVRGAMRRSEESDGMIKCAITMMCVACCLWHGDGICQLTMEIELDVRETLVGDAVSGALVYRNTNDEDIAVHSALGIDCGEVMICIDNGSRVIGCGMDAGVHINYWRTHKLPIVRGEKVYVPFYLLKMSGDLVLSQPGEHAARLCRWLIREPEGVHPRRTRLRF